MQSQRLTEEALISGWKPRREDRPADAVGRTRSQAWTAEKAERQAIGRQGIQREKQRAYAAECSPVQDGDEDILALYASGMSVQEVSRHADLAYETTRLRILACHPDARSLK